MVLPTLTLMIHASQSLASIHVALARHHNVHKGEHFLGPGITNVTMRNAGHIHRDCC